MIATSTGERVTGIALIDLGWSPEAVLCGYTSAPGVLPVLRALADEVFHLRLDAPDFLAQLLSLRGRYQVAFPTTLGTYGEDGKLQGFLEILDIPYVGSGVAASAIGMHKGLTKRLLRDMGLPVADGIAVPFPSPPPPFEEARDRLGCPFVIKPLASGGGAMGFAAVRDEPTYRARLARTVAEHRHVLLEQYLDPPPRADTSGEFTVGVLGERVLPVCEVRRRDAPTRAGSQAVEESVKESAVAQALDPLLAGRLQEIALAVHHGTGCHGMSRTDIRLGRDGEPRVMEFNTLPGLLPESAFVKACVAAGIGAEQMVTTLIDYAFRPRPMEIPKMRASGPPPAPSSA
jgi:D-alanine-D-alanine ligase